MQDQDSYSSLISGVMCDCVLFGAVGLHVLFMSDFDEDFDELEEIEVKDSSVPPLLDLPTDDSLMVDVQIETKDQDEKPEGQGRHAKVKKSPKRRRVTRNRSVVWAHFSKSTLANGEYGLRVVIKIINESDDEDQKLMAEMMKGNFDKYYGEVKNLVILMAYVFDPRNKLRYLDVVLVDVYGQVDGNAVEKEMNAGESETVDLS
ncbi:OLC1v1025777C1 [Oldenlandia corymbosa var. corymbosa]|uniref:OLC1v1025777C1 n=1 Tax=Oldenlandia corymbosa var. corymbosa TaxID=529605 RepID=A0AAV1C7X1_OLDCO|nr:OLC1v1025777C1 [Oldenlandia corymbosa var. corymbosa]